MVLFVFEVAQEFRHALQLLLVEAERDPSMRREFQLSEFGEHGVRRRRDRFAEAFPVEEDVAERKRVGVAEAVARSRRADQEDVAGAQLQLFAVGEVGTSAAADHHQFGKVVAVQREFALGVAADHPQRQPPGGEVFGGGEVQFFRSHTPLLLINPDMA